MKRFLFSLLLTSTLLLGGSRLPVFAQGAAQTNTAVNAANTATNQATNQPANQGSSAQLTNPLGTTSLPVIFGRVAKAFIGILGAAALLMYVIGGILWMTGGTSKRVETGKSILVNSTIGLLIVFFSYFISIAFLAFFGAH